jgi:hypothetical protein
LTSRTLFLTLVVLVGLVFQTPMHRAGPWAGSQGGGVEGCPATIPDLDQMTDQKRTSSTEVICRGWMGQDFERGTAPATVMVRDADPRRGEPCRDLYYYRVTFVEEEGGVSASFTFAGGVGQASFPLSPDQLAMIADHTAYVTDVQLGSYEPGGQTESRTGLACRINPTYHSYCTATRGLDQFCYTWVRRQAAGGGGAVPGFLPGLGRSPQRWRVN